MPDEEFLNEHRWPPLPPPMMRGMRSKEGDSPKDRERERERGARAKEQENFTCSLEGIQEIRRKRTVC